MDLGLNGRAAIVTGAGSGIGAGHDRGTSVQSKIHLFMS